MDLDYLDLFESFLDRTASGGAAQVVTCSVRDAGQEDGQIGRDVEVWGQGCVVYRPAPPDGAGKAQALATRIGGTLVAFATRDTRASEAVGDLASGDAAFCSPTGKTALVCKADGSMAMLKQGTDADSMVAIEKDGALILRTPWGQVQFDADGFAIMLTSGEVFNLGKGQMTLGATQVNLATGTVGLGVGASVPLAAVPLLPIATVGSVPAFAPALPVTRILVPPS